MRSITPIIRREFKIEKFVWIKLNPKKLKKLHTFRRLISNIEILTRTAWTTAVDDWYAWKWTCICEICKATKLIMRKLKLIIVALSWVDLSIFVLDFAAQQQLFQDIKKMNTMLFVLKANVQDHIFLDFLNWNVNKKKNSNRP